MALPGLLARLNCREYKNWLKAGQCLLMLQDRLHGYLDRQMQAFHRELSSWITWPRRRKKCQCRATGKQFQPSCPVCAQWKELILAHHNNRNGDIYWGNSNPSLWPTQYWEVAKVYMPRGQAQATDSKQCDAAALLNLINNCDYFKGPNLSRVRELIKCRNELMHSSDMTVSSPWLERFGQKIFDLIAEFKHVPGLVTEGEKMKQVLLLDLSVDVIEVDGPEIAHAQSQPGRVVLQSATFIPKYEKISLSLEDIEILLIQQLIQELCLDIEEQGSLTKENEDKVCKIKNFFFQNEDLKYVLQEDLARLDSLRKNCVPPNAEGWIHPQHFATFLGVLTLAFFTAFFLGQRH